MKRVPEGVLVILDEAYFEFAHHDPVFPDSMQYRLDNVITLRTFSKIYGLAGIRIGYGFAHDVLISNLLKVKLPFEPNSLAQAAGIAALGDSQFLHRSLMVNDAGKRQLVPAMEHLGLTVIPSDTNFVMVPLASEAAALAVYDGLLHHGVIVRPLRAFGLPHCLRITPFSTPPWSAGGTPHRPAAYKRHTVSSPTTAMSAVPMTINHQPLLIDGSDDDDSAISFAFLHTVYPLGRSSATRR